MAITRVSNTKDLASAIDYSLEEKSKEKKKSNLPRVLAVQANLLDQQHAKEQMQSVLQRFNKANGNFVQAYRIIQSFHHDELNYKNHDDIIKANEIGLELARKLFPENQALVVTQADGEGNKVHNHIIVNSVSTLDGRSLRSNAKSWRRISDASDKIIAEHGMTPLDKSKRSDVSYGINEKFILTTDRASWKDKIREAVDLVKENEDINDFDSLQMALNQLNIDIVLRGKTLTYKLLEDDKEKKVRAKKLGAIYEWESLKNEFEFKVEQREKTNELQQKSTEFKSRELEYHARYDANDERKSKNHDEKHRKTNVSYERHRKRKRENNKQSGNITTRNKSEKSRKYNGLEF